MPSTSNKGYEIQATGSNSGTWGDVLNDSMISYVDVNMAGVTSKTLSSSNVTLTADEARNAMVRLNGTLTSSVQITSANVGFYYVENLTSGSFNVTVTNGVSGVVIPQSRRCVVFADTTNGVRIVGIAGSSGADPIPTGTAMLFYQNAAPVGWTISSALNDYGIKIVSSAGGVTSGSVDYSTLFARTTTDAHTLTTSEIPSHNHTFTYTSTTATGVATPIPLAFFTSGGTTTVTTAATGGGDGHSHTIDMRVKTASVIIATKV